MTERLYFNDSYCFEASPLVNEAEFDQEKSEWSLVLDKTIFHPPGGGQPSDEGQISSHGVLSLAVDKDLGTIKHKVACKDGASFSPGDLVFLNVDEVVRRRHARLHSAGHLMDVAVRKMGLMFQSSKAYHYPDGSYVEYLGSVPVEERELMAKKIMSVANETIQKTKDTDLVTSRIEQDGTRLVFLSSEDIGCPCGGTHVKHVKEIGHVTVTRLVEKKKFIRVCYSVTNLE
uniref:Threonyl/alanyl tRNA synthetase SAD domain-containing protein n=1 Tax=Rhodosorus marinus TaxID=101924 RepID=A0A7S0BNT4_9RHOD|mmetsp:Transcript_25325/g.36460  ORF Transcript_25325/g.36460 Transcript_25325/m.36460 type:complete len:231 (+) Transcript_25325:89-781(+)